MSSSEYATGEIPDFIVTLNITETNITINGSKAKTFSKTPHDDTSINNIIFGIGAVVVILIFILIIIKLISKCYKMYKANDDEIKETVNQSPLIPSSNVARRKSSVRDPTAPMHRSSLDIETQMAIRQKRLSQTYNTPPIAKKP